MTNKEIRLKLPFPLPTHVSVHACTQHTSTHTDIQENHRIHNFINSMERIVHISSFLSTDITKSKFKKASLVCSKLKISVIKTKS